MPARDVVYEASRTGADIGLQGNAYQCPIQSGDLEQDANAYYNSVPLTLYQIDRPFENLRLVRDGTTIRFEY